MSKSKYPSFLLEGVYTRVWRTPNFKTKGLILEANGRETIVALPKQLRVLMASEIQPGDRLRILAEQKKDKLSAVNIMKVTAVAAMPELCDVSPDRLALELLTPVLPEPESEPAAPSAPPTVKICKKGTCRKRGSLELLEQWQAERDRDPALAGVECRLTGCLKACKAGVNVRVGDRVVSHAQKLNLSALVAKAARS